MWPGTLKQDDPMEDLVPIIAVLSVFGSLTAICTLPPYFKHRNQRDMQKTVRTAIGQGQNLPVELIDALTADVKKNLPSRTRDIRRGVLWIAAGIGVAMMGVFGNINFGEERWVGTGTMGVASIPFIFGVAYLILAFFNKNTD